MGELWKGQMAFSWREARGVVFGSRGDATHMQLTANRHATGVGRDLLQASVFATRLHPDYLRTNRGVTSEKICHFTGHSSMFGGGLSRKAETKLVPTNMSCNTLPICQNINKYYINSYNKHII